MTNFLPFDWSRGVNQLISQINRDKVCKKLLPTKLDFFKDLSCYDFVRNNVYARKTLWLNIQIVNSFRHG